MLRSWADNCLNAAAALEGCACVRWITDWLAIWQPLSVHGENKISELAAFLTSTGRPRQKHTARRIKARDGPLGESGLSGEATRRGTNTLNCSIYSIFHSGPQSCLKRSNKLCFGPTLALKRPFAGTRRTEVTAPTRLHSAQRPIIIYLSAAESSPVWTSYI